MGLNVASWYQDNLGSPSTTLQLGPFNLGTCSKMLHISCGITVTTPGVTLGPANFLLNGIVWGMQWVDHDGSPVDLPFYAYTAGFFWAKMIGKDVFQSATWTPDTDNAAFLSANTEYYDWRGQKPMGGDIDLFVSAGATTGDVVAFEATMQAKIWNMT